VIYTIISVYSNILILTFFVKFLIQFYTNFTGFFTATLSICVGFINITTLRDIIKFIVTTFATLSFRIVTQFTLKQISNYKCVFTIVWFVGKIVSWSYCLRKFRNLLFFSWSSAHQSC